MYTSIKIQKILKRASIPLIKDRIGYYHKNKISIKRDIGHVEIILTTCNRELF